MLWEDPPWSCWGRRWGLWRYMGSNMRSRQCRYHTRTRKWRCAWNKIRKYRLQLSFRPCGSHSSSSWSLYLLYAIQCLYARPSSLSRRGFSFLRCTNCLVYTDWAYWNVLHMACDFVYGRSTTAYDRQYSHHSVTEDDTHFHLLSSQQRDSPTQICSQK